MQFWTNSARLNFENTAFQNELDFLQDRCRQNSDIRIVLSAIAFPLSVRILTSVLITFHPRIENSFALPEELTGNYKGTASGIIEIFL